MILAILPDVSGAETLLNNLSEAEFDLANVSVVMADTATREKIAADGGPLKGVAAAKLVGALKSVGVAKDAIDRCKAAVKDGKVLVAMNVDPKYQAAALEMFKDMSADIVQQ